LRSATVDEAARETRQHANAATHLCRTFRRLQALGTQTPRGCPPRRSSTGAPSSALARSLATMQARSALAPRRPTSARNFDVARARARVPYQHCTFGAFSYSSFVAPQRRSYKPCEGMGCDSKTGIPWRRSRLTVLHAACDVLCGDRSARLSLRAGQNSESRTCEGCVQ